MSKPVNLNQFRKQKIRAEQKKRAEQNRVNFGRTKSEKELSKRQTEKIKADLDGHKLTDET
jgi:hypothetical protein